MEKANNSFEEIWEKLSAESVKKILMTLHAGPDGDSIGSCAAMKYALEKEGKEVKLVSGDKIAYGLDKFDFAEEVEVDKDIRELDLKKFDVLLCLDTATPEMLGKFTKDYKLPSDVFSINLDHHETNVYYGDLNYVDDKNGSTCSILVDFFKSLDFNFDKELATRLLLGICTDSGFFRNRQGLEEAMEKALFLMKHGADYSEIISNVLHTKTLKMKKYYGKILENLKTDEKRKFCYSSVSLDELNLNIAEIRSGVYAVSDLDGMDFSFLLTKYGNKIKGSFRSDKGVDVSRFAKELGGGGHKAAAGIYLENISLEEAENKILEVIDKIGIEKD